MDGIVWSVKIERGWKWPKGNKTPNSIACACAIFSSFFSFHSFFSRMALYFFLADSFSMFFISVNYVFMHRPFGIKSQDTHWMKSKKLCARVWFCTRTNLCAFTWKKYKSKWYYWNSDYFEAVEYKVSLVCFSVKLCWTDNSMCACLFLNKLESDVAYFWNGLWNSVCVVSCCNAHTWIKSFVNIRIQ